MIFMAVLSQIGIQIYHYLCIIHEILNNIFSVSSRISKGQGYRGFLRKRAGSSFGGQFASYKEKLEKWTEFTTFRVNKKF
jgi:hypothetical protein